MLENVISAPCAPLSSIYMSMAQLLAHFSFFLMAPLYIANGWHVVFNPSSPLLGSLVATLVIASALAQLFQQHLVAYQITSPTRLVNGSRYVIYTSTPITTIMGVAGQLTWQVLHVSSFLVVFVGCLRTLVVRGQDFPQLWAPLSLCKLAWVAPRVPSAWNGGS